MPVKKQLEINTQNQQIEKTTRPTLANVVADNFSFGLRNKISLWTVFVLLAAAALAWNIKLRSDLKHSKQSLANLQTSPGKNVEDARQVLSQVNALLVLPAGELPTIATVNDLEKLKGQAFFQNAQVGDKVLIFSQSQKVVLYRPSENKIVEVAPINTAGAPASAEISIEIRNGSGKIGAGGEFKNQIAVKPGFNVVSLGNAKATYLKTQIIVLDKAVPENLLSELKRLSGGDVVYSLPEGEAPSSAQVVLILGQY